MWRVQTLYRSSWRRFSALIGTLAVAMVLGCSGSDANKAVPHPDTEQSADSKTTIGGGERTLIHTEVEPEWVAPGEQCIFRIRVPDRPGLQSYAMVGFEEDFTLIELTQEAGDWTGEITLGMWTLVGGPMMLCGAIMVTLEEGREEGNEEVHS